MLEYSYFEKYYKLLAIHWSKQQQIDADRKAIIQINFTGKVNRAEDATMFFIFKEVKETFSYFSKGTVKVLWFHFVLL